MKARNVLPTVLLSAVLPCAAAMPECMEEDHQLQMVLLRHPPIDPRVMTDVLKLRHEGLGLCQRGAGAQGRGKLEQAQALATPPGLAAGGVPGATPSSPPARRH